MDVYGLTGGIGSGKSAVAALLEEYGVPVVSADELSRIVVSRGSDGLGDVVRTFGPQIIDESGELDRRKMAAIVFQDPGKRRQLESILHPRIRERFEQVLDALEKAGHEVAVYEVPLLFEKNLQGEMKAVVLVSAEEGLRIHRVRARDDVTETEVRARIKAQMGEDQKRKRADYILENNGSMDDLRREVEFLLSRFLRVGVTRRSGQMPAVDDASSPSRMATQVPTTMNTQVAVENPFTAEGTQISYTPNAAVPDPVHQDPVVNPQSDRPTEPAIHHSLVRPASPSPVAPTAPESPGAVPAPAQPAPPTPLQPTAPDVAPVAKPAFKRPAAPPVVQPTAPDVPPVTTPGPASSPTSPAPMQPTAPDAAPSSTPPSHTDRFQVHTPNPDESGDG